ncbi:hypothetical protein PENTCL1PPCAC_16924, partial [Pristionchus entomophagus]
CYYRHNNRGSDETEQRLKSFNLELTPSSETYAQMDCEVDLRGCNSVLDLLNVRANGEAINAGQEILVGSRLICSEHFCSLVTNWDRCDERSKNNRQTRSSADSTAVKCPLSHLKAVNAESHRVVDKVSAKAAKVTKPSKSGSKTTKKSTKKSSVRTTKGETRKRTVVEESDASE